MRLGPDVADRVTVLMYHRVGEVRSRAECKYCIEPARFAAQMGALADHGYQAAPIDALADWLAGGPPLKPRQFVLTFDDGFLGVHDHALPVLAALAWPCTVFLVTDQLGGYDSWHRNDGAAAGRQRLLGAEHIGDMRLRGCNFHSHTRTHTSLPALDDVALAAELSESRAAVRALTGDDCRFLAYPYGHVDDRVEAAARLAGYKAAFATQPGFNRREVNPLRIRRLDVWGTDTPAMLLRKIRLGSNDGSAAGAARYYWRQAASRLPHGRK